MKLRLFHQSLFALFAGVLLNLGTQAQAESSQYSDGKYYLAFNHSFLLFLNKNNTAYAEKDADGNTQSLIYDSDWQSYWTSETANNQLVFSGSADFNAATGASMGAYTPTVGYDTENFSIGGITVLAGTAEGASLTAYVSNAVNTSKRDMIWRGVSEANGKSLFDIQEDFLLSTTGGGSTAADAGSIFMEADALIKVAAGKTFTIEGVLNSSHMEEVQTAYLQGGGSVDYTNTAKNTTAHSSTQNWVIADGSSLTVSSSLEGIISVCGDINIQEGQLILGENGSVRGDVTLAGGTDSSLTAGDMVITVKDSSLTRTATTASLSMKSESGLISSNSLVDVYVRNAQFAATSSGISLTDVTLQNVSFASGTSISATNLSLVVSEGYGVSIGADGLSMTVDMLAGTETTLTGTFVVSISLSDESLALIENTWLNGDDFTFNLEGIAGGDALATDDFVIYLNGEELTSTGSLAYDPTTGNISFTVIPEPSTATMSLLALAGMMMRRRRRKAC